MERTREIRAVMLIILLVLAFGWTAQGAGIAIQYWLTDLTVLAGPDSIWPAVGYGINDKGQVCGHGYLAGGSVTAQPFFFDPYRGHCANLGDMAGGFDGVYGGNGYGINRAGWVVGRNYDTAKKYHGFLWIDDNGNGQRELNEMRDLAEGLPYTSSTAQDVNNSGQVCGYDTYGSGSSSVTLGWLWTDRNQNKQIDSGEKIYFGSAVPVSVNDAGQVALTWQNQAWRWTDLNGDYLLDSSEMVAIPNVVSGLTASANSIDRQGRVGGSMKNGANATMGFLWTDVNSDNVADASEVVMFGDTGKNTFVRNMNDLGQIAGGSLGLGTDYGRAAYIWDAMGGIRNLNDLIEPYTLAGHGPLYMSQAEGVNNRGQIVASGWFDDDGNLKKGSAEVEHAMLLTPIIPGDMNRDADVDMDDLAGLAAVWLNENCPAGSACDRGDWDNNQRVDEQDLVYFVENWLKNANYN